MPTTTTTTIWQLIAQRVLGAYFRLSCVVVVVIAALRRATLLGLRSPFVIVKSFTVVAVPVAVVAVAAAVWQIKAQIVAKL